MEKTPYTKKFRKGSIPAKPLSRLSLTETGMGVHHGKNKRALEHFTFEMLARICLQILAAK